MKIIVVSPFSPFPPYWGGGSRIFQLVKHLSDHGEIIFIYNDLKQIVDVDENNTPNELINKGVRIKKIKSLGRFSQFVHPLLFLTLLRKIKEIGPDYVICEFLWPSLMVGLACKIARVPMVLDEHNVESIRMERMGRSSGIVSKCFRRYEGTGVSLSYLTLCVSDKDLDLLKSIGANKSEFYILPNAVDGRAYKEKVIDRKSIRRDLGFDESTPLILFHGKLDYAPNLEALNNIVREIVPRLREKIPAAKIVIAGSNPPNDLLMDDMFKITGIYRDLPGLLSAVDVVICPLETGGGTRIKIVEALFAKKWVVSTPIGAEGIDVSETNELLQLASNWDDFVDKMVWVLGNTDVSNLPSESFFNRYDWGRSIVKFISYLTE